MRVLLVEANKVLSRALKRGLEHAGFAVDVAGDGTEADSKARATDYDLIVLDLVLPEMDGLALMRQWRQAGVQPRILVLRAKERAEDNHQENSLHGPILRVHDLEINNAARTVKRAGRSIHLTPREFTLLQYLASHRGRVVTRSMLRGRFYDAYDDNRRLRFRLGAPNGKPSNIIDVYIRYLRNKIDKGFKEPLILTRWGQGYLFRSDEE